MGGISLVEGGAAKTCSHSIQIRAWFRQTELQQGGAYPMVGIRKPRGNSVKDLRGAIQKGFPVAPSGATKAMGWGIWGRNWGKAPGFRYCQIVTFVELKVLGGFTPKDAFTFFLFFRVPARPAAGKKTMGLGAGYEGVSGRTAPFRGFPSQVVRPSRQLRGFGCGLARGEAIETAPCFY